MAVFEIGTGRIRSITGSDPPAGKDGSVAIPNNVVWRIIAMRQTCVLGTAADHTTGVIIKDASGNRIAFIIHDVTFNLGGPTTIIYNTFNPYYKNGYGSDRYAIGIPEDLYLLPGYKIGGFMVTAVNDDDWGSPQMLVEEWILPQGSGS